MSVNRSFADADPRSKLLPGDPLIESEVEPTYLPPADLLDRPNARGQLLIVHGKLGGDVTNGPIFASVGRPLGRRKTSWIALNRGALLYWRSWLIAHEELGLTQANFGAALHGHFSGKPWEPTARDHARTIRDHFPRGAWEQFVLTGALPED